MYKDDFPLLSDCNGVHYLDSAATSQRPKCVIDGIAEYYRKWNGNAGRGSHNLSAKSSALIEEARKTTADFLKVCPNEIVFTKNCTEALNLIAYSYGLSNLSKDDEILLPISNHHANIVPWQYVCKVTGAKLRYAYLDSDGNLDMNSFYSKISNRTKIIAFSGVVNTTGAVNPVKEIIKAAESVKAVTVLDAAQSLLHFENCPSDLGCSFLAFSGHKIFSSFGVGVLYGKSCLLEKMPPFLYGGDMVDYVNEEQSTYKSVPHKFEGGTMNTEAIYSLHLALNFVRKKSFEKISHYMEEIGGYAAEELAKLPFIEIYHAKAKKTVSIIAFNVKGVHPHDTSCILNEKGVMVRSGLHCTHPLMAYMGVPACCRASFSIYNSKDDVDALIAALYKVKEIFKE